MSSFVLVHGAWHGGWCWDEVACRLRAAGHVVAAPTLLGLAERAGDWFADDPATAQAVAARLTPHPCANPAAASTKAPERIDTIRAPRSAAAPKRQGDLRRDENRDAVRSLAARVHRRDRSGSEHLARSPSSSATPARSTASAPGR